jgi:ABC-type amino acid transport substrate-binding protein
MLQLALRFIICFSLLISSVTMLSLPVNAAESEALIGDIRRIQNKGTLTIGIPPYNTPPFYYKDPRTEELLGYDVEIARALASKLEVAPKFDTASRSFNDLVYRAGRGDVDLAIGKLGITYARIFNANPHAYMKFHQALLVNRKFLVKLGNENDPQLGTRLQKSNLRIAAIKNSAYDARASSQFQNATLMPSSNWDDAVKSLLSGKVDAIYRDSLEISMLVLQDPRLALEFASVVIEDLDDVKAIFVGESNTGVASLIDFLISDEYPVINESQVIERYHRYFQKLS